MLVRLAAVAIFALAPVAGTVSTMPVVSRALAKSGGFFPKAAILDWSGQRFNVIRVDSFDRFTSQYARLNEWIDGNRDRVAEMQATIRQNRRLASALTARGVQIQNVGAVQQAFNGNLTFYLK